MKRLLFLLFTLASVSLPAQTKTFVTYTPTPWSSPVCYGLNDMVTTGSGASLATFISLLPNNCGNNPATTAYTAWNPIGSAGTSPVTSVFGRVGPVTAQSGDYSVTQVTGAAPIASPNFTGTPTVPTQTTGDASSAAASDQFVQNAITASSGGAQSYTVGATAVVQYTAVMSDGNNHIIPANITAANASLYRGIALSSGTPGQTVSVVAGDGIPVPLTFESGSTPVVGHYVVFSTATASYGEDSGVTALGIIQPRVPVIGVVSVVPGSYTGQALVTLQGLGVSGTGDFLVDNKTTAQTLPYGALNGVSFNSTQTNQKYTVAGYDSPGIIPGWTPSALTTFTGVADGTNRVFNSPNLSLARAFTIYINGAISNPAIYSSNGTLITASTYNTSGSSVTFNTAPPSGAVITGMATDLDMARAFADTAALAGANATLELKPGINYGCGGARLPLPYLGGTYASTHIFGQGGGNTTIQPLSLNCNPAQAMLWHGAATSAGIYPYSTFIGFSVDDQNVDNEACSFWWGQNIVIWDVHCRAAAVGGSDEASFGGPLTNGSLTYAFQVYAYSFQAVGGDVHHGKNNPFTLAWTTTAGVSTLNTMTYNPLNTSGEGGSASNASYSQFASIIFFGPGLAGCTTPPAAHVVFGATTASQSTLGQTFNYAPVSSAAIDNVGSCTDITHIYAAVIDGETPLGVNIQNATDSVFTNLDSYGAYTKASIYLSPDAGNNTFNGLHGWSGEFATLWVDAAGAKITGVECDSPSAWCIVVGGAQVSITGVSFSQDTPAYQGASGIWLHPEGVLNGVNISNWSCSGSGSSLNAANPYFNMVATNAGIPSTTNPVPYGTDLNGMQICDGTNLKMNMNASGNTIDLVGWGFGDGRGFYSASSPTPVASPTLGLRTDLANGFVSLHNKVAGIAQPDPLGVGNLGDPWDSQPFLGTIGVRPNLYTTASPTFVTIGTAGTGNATYSCAPIDGFGHVGTESATVTYTLTPATLSATNAVGIVCPPSPGAHSMNVYLRANDLGRAQGMIGNISQATSQSVTQPYLKDTGLVGNGNFPPATPFSGVCFSQVVPTSSSANACIEMGNTSGQANWVLPSSGNGGTLGPLVGGFTSTAVTSESFTLTGMVAGGHCSALSPTNSSASTNAASTYISAKATNAITITHPATAGMTFDVSCTNY